MSATSCSQPNSGDISVVYNECQVFILCEDLATYQQAADVCKHMVTQFDTELDFGFNCWDFNDLSDPVCAHAAMKIADMADIILLALSVPKMPLILTRWLEAMPPSRLRNSRVLALVTDATAGEPLDLKQVCLQLERTAHRLGMDFLPLCSAPDRAPNFAMPQSVGVTFPVAARPKQFGDPQSCDHWGLNE